MASSVIKSKYSTAYGIYSSGLINSATHSVPLANNYASGFYAGNVNGWGNEAGFFELINGVITLTPLTGTSRFSASVSGGKLVFGIKGGSSIRDITLLIG